MPYFDEPVGRVKIQTTSKNYQRYYTTKRLIRDLLSNTPNGCVRAGEFRRLMRSGTKLAREIQLTDWSTAGNLSNRSAGVQIPRDICTRFGRSLYSTKGSWIRRTNTSCLNFMDNDATSSLLAFLLIQNSQGFPSEWEKSL